MKKTTLTLLILALIVIHFTAVKAQRIWANPIGQYAFNPAGAAMHDLVEITSSYYNFFGSASNSPYGFMLMGTAPFATENIGAGFKLISETGGAINMAKAEGTFMYRIAVAKNAKLAFAVSGVYNQMSLLRSKIHAKDPDDPFLQSANSGFWGDANAGVSFYQQNKYYVGLAFNNLIANHSNFAINQFQNHSSPQYIFSGMYLVDLLKGNGKLELTGVASNFLSQKTSLMAYDLTTRIILKKSFWLGAGYSINTIKALAGIYFQNFSFGYTAGIATGAMSGITYNVARHELFVKLNLNNSKSSKNVSTTN